MRSVKIAVILAIFALFCGGNLLVEEPAPVGDFFHGKKLTYKVEMEILGMSHDAGIKIVFFKTSADRYQIILDTKKNKINYRVVAKGFVKNNKLHPLVVTEDTKILSFEYHTVHWYNYNKDGSWEVDIECKNPSSGYSAKTFTFADIKPVDLLSGVFQQIYNLNFGYELEKLNIVRSDYVLWGAQFKKFKCGDDTCIKLKDAKQEKDFNLYGPRAKLNKDSWPSLVTVEKTWIIKDIKMSLIQLEALPESGPN